MTVADRRRAGGVARRSRRAAAVAASVIGLLVVLGGPPAAAAGSSCTGRTGVSVVVDFGPLGGGTQQVCVPSGAGSNAAEVTSDGGFTVTFTNDGQPFVCRINGEPAQEDCNDTPPGNAYWGLFWSDGTSGWTYSTRGATALEADDGWSIGWRFQDGGDLEKPSAGPHKTPPPSPSPSPSSSTPKPTANPAPATRTPRPSATSPGAVTSADPSGLPVTTGPKQTTRKPSRSAEPSETPSESPRELTTELPTDESSDAAEGSLGTVSDPDEPTGPGNDTGVAAVAGLGGLAVLAGSAAVVAYRRQKS
jgi:hypothetical protein